MEEKEPLKWKKHLILPMFGLRTMEDLKNEIHRYSFLDIPQMIEDIQSDMVQQKREQSLYTVSLIKKEQLRGLPNVSITTQSELEDFYKQYAQSKEFSEIWFCKKKNNPDQMFSIGRISFDTRDVVEDIYTQILEQVWNTTHRDIEKYNGKYEKAYLKAKRRDWNMRYHMETLKLPKQEEISKEQMISEFMQAVKEIERKREKIEQMAMYFKKLGINEFSLEYLLEEGKFLFIDWDSQDDHKVIRETFDKEEQR